MRDAPLNFSVAGAAFIDFDPIDKDVEDDEDDVGAEALRLDLVNVGVDHVDEDAGLDDVDARRESSKALDANALAPFLTRLHEVEEKAERASLKPASDSAFLDALERRLGGLERQMLTGDD